MVFLIFSLLLSYSLNYTSLTSNTPLQTAKTPPSCQGTLGPKTQICIHVSEHTHSRLLASQHAKATLHTWAGWHLLGKLLPSGRGGRNDTSPLLKQSHSFMTGEKQRQQCKKSRNGSHLSNCDWLTEI